MRANPTCACLLALATSAFAGRAHVVNNCNFEVWYSVSSGASADGWKKLGKTPYRIKYETPLNTLEAHARRFAELGIADQCRVLMQILNLFNTSAASADLKLLCGKAGIGRLVTSKNISGYAGHSLLLIHQSVTGMFEKQINLLGDEF